MFTALILSANLALSAPTNMEADRVEPVNKIQLNGQLYNDDRMFVMAVSKCTVRTDSEFVETQVHHEEAPPNHIWCVVTYRNVERYPAYRTDHFDTEQEAISYLQVVEPGVPLVSLGGTAPRITLPYTKFVEWKKMNNFQEYDYKKMYSPGGENAREIMMVPRK